MAAAQRLPAGCRCDGCSSGRWSWYSFILFAPGPRWKARRAKYPAPPRRKRHDKRYVTSYNCEKLRVVRGDLTRRSVPHLAGGTVEKALFSIHCTTCRARLAVHRTEAIGAILECPKCGSMVLVDPPPGWVPDQSGADGSANPEPAGLAPAGLPPPSAEAGGGKPPSGKGSAVRRRSLAEATVAVATPAKLPLAKPLAAKPQAGADVLAKPQAGAEVLAKPQAAVAPPVMPQAVALMDAVAAAPATPAVGFTPPQAVEPPVEASGRWSSLMGSVLGRWLVLGVSPVLGLALVLGVWAMVHRRASPGLPEQGPDAAATGPAQPAEPAHPQAAGFAGPDRRWLPDETRLVAMVRGASLAAHRRDGNCRPRWQPGGAGRWGLWSKGSGCAGSGAADNLGRRRPFCRA